MRFSCDSCLAEFDVPYWRLGSSYSCPSCGHSFRLERAHIRAYTPSGYEVTFTDFVQLVTDPYYRETILPLIRSWFNFEPVKQAEGGEGELQFRDAVGKLYDALEVHARIQNEPSWQRQLYNNAMTLWH
jgi:hypothetical protein